jgi:hypothetical protein
MKHIRQHVAQWNVAWVNKIVVTAIKFLAWVNKIVVTAIKFLDLLPDLHKAKGVLFRRRLKTNLFWHFENKQGKFNVKNFYQKIRENILIFITRRWFLQLAGNQERNTSYQCMYIADYFRLQYLLQSISEIHRKIITRHRLSSHNFPVRIRVRIDPPHPIVCRKRRLNGAVLRIF